MIEKTFLTSQHYNLSLTQEKGLNEHNFISLKRISEEEGLEIIIRGFKLQNERKISLKKYYESREEYSLFQLKGYSINYKKTTFINNWKIKIGTNGFERFRESRF